MSLKKLVTNSLLLAVGAVLHAITPPILLGMKPDFSLIMLFIILILDDDYKSCISVGIVAGILSAATTTFPAGQVPNLIDKFLTVNIMFAIIKPFRKVLNNQIKTLVFTPIGTIISGTIFLVSASILAGLPGSLKALFLGVVIPAALINTIAGIVMYNAINVAIKRRSTR